MVVVVKQWLTHLTSTQGDASSIPTLHFSCNNNNNNNDDNNNNNDNNESSVLLQSNTRLKLLHLVYNIDSTRKTKAL